MDKPELAAKLRLGFIVFWVLIVLEVVEYAVGIIVQRGNWPFLGILAVMAAWPILQYFMHILQLRQSKD